MSGNYPDGVNQQVFDEAHGEMDEREFDDLEFDDDLGFDCHMDHNGQCGKAGSEECDFECPTMLAIHRAEAAKVGKSRDNPRTFALLVDAHDYAVKHGYKVWAVVTHYPGFVFEIYPGGRTIKREERKRGK